MRRSLFIFFFLLFAVLNVSAQSAKEKIAANPQLAGNNYYAYPGPTSDLTSAPKGYKPFYISHYGRHGSRWLTNGQDYTMSASILHKADSLGVLTPYGHEIMLRLDTLRDMAYLRTGELTPLGARQHKEIARRMVSRFPEVFNGAADIDARSTVVARTMLSMSAACQALIAINPSLDIVMDASNYDLYYMNYLSSDKTASSAANKLGRNEKYNKAYGEFSKNHIHPQRVMGLLFTDQSFIKGFSMGGRKMDFSSMLYNGLFSLATDMQSLDTNMSLMDIFTTDELYDLSCMGNLYWYNACANSPYSGSIKPFFQANLLRNIIFTADSVIAAGGHGATLRFGHDDVLLPLICLMELNDYNYSTENLEELFDHFATFELIPMAANLQIIFFKNKSGHVLIKILHNENEVKLPVKTDNAPYYDWNDVRKYYLDKVAGYPEKCLTELAK